MRTLEARIEAAKAERRAAIATGDHKAATEAMRKLSLLAAEHAGFATRIRFDPKMVRRFNRH